MNTCVGRIYVDCDDVIFKFTQGVLDKINAQEGTNWKEDDIQGWGLEPAIPPGRNWWDYSSSPGFYKELEVYMEAQPLLDAVCASGRQWAFLSSLPIKHPGCLQDRRDAIDKRFSVNKKGVLSQRLIVAKRKELVLHAGDVLIDDYPDNIRAVELVGATGLLVSRGHNRNNSRQLRRWTLLEVIEWLKNLPPIPYNNIR